MTESLPFWHWADRPGDVPLLSTLVPPPTRDPGLAPSGPPPTEEDRCLRVCIGVGATVVVALYLTAWWLLMAPE